MPKLNDSPERSGISAQPPIVRDLLHRLTELDRELYAHARNMRHGTGKRWWRS